MKRTLTTAIFILALALGALAAYPARGYRGFVEQNIEIGWEKGVRYGPSPGEGWSSYYDDYTSVFALFGLSTSHGYQFNPHFFLGAGMTFQIGAGEVMRRLELPLFLHARTDWQLGKYPVYGDLRVGGTLSPRQMKGGEDKLQITPSVGYRWNWGRRTCGNIAIGVGLHGCDDSGMSTHFTWHPLPLIRFGIEF